MINITMFEYLKYKNLFNNTKTKLKDLIGKEIYFTYATKAEDYGIYKVEEVRTNPTFVTLKNLRGNNRFRSQYVYEVSPLHAFFFPKTMGEWDFVQKVTSMIKNEVDNSISALKEIKNSFPDLDVYDERVLELYKLFKEIKGNNFRKALEIFNKI